MTPSLPFDACKKSLQDAVASAQRIYDADVAAGGNSHNSWRCLTYAKNALAYCEQAEKESKRRKR